MKSLLRILTVALLCLPCIVSAGDSFDKIKSELADAKCTRLEFISIIESDIFDSVDSTDGEAYVAADGRYVVRFNADTYLWDLKHLYSYSEENNQVTVEKMDSSSYSSEEISFITRLDEYYLTEAVIPDEEYRLYKKSADIRNIPDSLRLKLDQANDCIDFVEYYDINEEKNRLQFIQQETFPHCDSSLFIPDFPDSVETVKLW